jgi:hypothetical protein
LHLKYVLREYYYKLMSLINKILPDCNLSAGQTKTWASTAEGGEIGCRVTALVEEDGVLRIDVVEWDGPATIAVMSLALDEGGKVLELTGIPDEEPAPVTEFALRLRALVSDMNVVE